MGFDATKDKILWQSEPSSEGFTVRVMKYGDKGKPKIAFVRLYEDFEGETKEKNGGRLFLEDVDYFGLVWAEARKVMKQILTSDPSFKPVYADEVDMDEEYSNQGRSVYDDEEQS